MQAIRVLAFVAIAAMAAGCATTNGPVERRAERYAEVERHAGEPVSRFDFWDMDRFEVLGRYDVLVWTTINEAYLIRVSKPCSGLEFATGLGVTSTNRTVYRNFDAVVFGDQRCRIAEIRPVDGRALRMAGREGDHGG